MKTEYMEITLEDNEFKIKTARKEIPKDIAEDILNTVCNGLSALWHKERRYYRITMVLQTACIIVLLISVIAMYNK